MSNTWPQRSKRLPGFLAITMNHTRYCNMMSASSTGLITTWIRKNCIYLERHHCLILCIQTAAKFDYPVVLASWRSSCTCPMWRKEVKQPFLTSICRWSLNADEPYCGRAHWMAIPNSRTPEHFIEQTLFWKARSTLLMRGSICMTSHKAIYGDAPEHSIIYDSFFCA